MQIVSMMFPRETRVCGRVAK